MCSCFFVIFSLATFFNYAHCGKELPTRLEVSLYIGIYAMYVATPFA